MQNGVRPQCGQDWLEMLGSVTANTAERVRLVSPRGPRAVQLSARKMLTLGLSPELRALFSALH
jgi:hypothetical protein